MSARIHRHVADRLSPYFEGELDRAERRQLEAHLAECDRCRRELRLLENAARFLAEPLAAGSDEEFLNRLDTRIDRAAAVDGKPIHLGREGRRAPGQRNRDTGRRSWRAFRPSYRLVVSSVAVAAAALVVIVSLPTGEPDGDPPPRESRRLSPAPPATLPSFPLLVPGGDRSVGGGAPSQADSVGTVASEPRRLEPAMPVAPVPLQWHVTTDAPETVRRRLLEAVRNTPGTRLVNQDAWSVTISAPGSRLRALHERLVTTTNSRVTQTGEIHPGKARLVLKVRFDRRPGTTPET